MHKQIDYIINQLINFATEINITTYSNRELKKLIDDVYYNHPITFHVGVINAVIDKANKTAKLIPTYEYSKSEYTKLNIKLKDFLDAFRIEVNRYKDEYQRELYVHDFLIKNVKYENCGKESHSIIGPILHHKGVCDGIARTVVVLLRCARINSNIVFGKAINAFSKNNVSHAWNIVNINNHLYNLDVTFDISLSNDNYIRYDYFNVNSDLIADSHFPNIDKIALFNNCIDCADNYYIKKKAVFNNDKELISYLKTTLNNSPKFLQFIYHGNKTVDELGEIIFRIGHKKGYKFTLSYSFNQSLKVYFFAFSNYKKRFLSIH